MVKKITDFLFYRHRYIIGSIAAALALVVILLVAGLYAPGGLAQAEIDSTVSSHQLGFANLFEHHNIIGLPYKLLQKLSINVFGLSILSIKLPSLLITLVAAISLFGLISIWDDRRSAILATVLAIISSRWLFLSQHGEVTVMIISLAIILVTALTRLTELSNRTYRTRTKKHTLALVFWLLLIFASAGLLFYLPMGAYIVFIVSLTMIMHPFVRLSLKRLNKLIGRYWYLIGLACLAVIITPIVIGAIREPDLAVDLLRIDDFNFNVIDNLKILIKDLLDFSPNQDSLYATPWFNLSALILAIIGIFREIRTSYKPRSSMVLMWLLSSLVLGLFNPTASLVAFTPLALSLAMGLDYIVTSWYRIFPRNPVARFVGLIPIVVLVSSLIVYDLKAYIASYIYRPSLANQFSRDLKLMRGYLKKHPEEEIILVVDSKNNEEAFYQILAYQNPRLTIAREYQSDSPHRQIATHQARLPINDYQVLFIMTSHFTQDADRFYVYKK